MTAIKKKTNTMQKAISVQLNEATEAMQKMEGDLTHASVTIKDNETKITDIEGKIAAANIEVEAGKQNLQKETAAHKITQATLEAALKEVEDLKAGAKSATQIAGEVLGAVGVPPVENVVPVALTSEELWAQYATITDPKAKNDFYNKHRDTLTPKAQQSR